MVGKRSTRDVMRGVVLVAAVTLAGCGGGIEDDAAAPASVGQDESPATAGAETTTTGGELLPGYDADMREPFVEGCLETDGATRELCGCTFDAMSTRMPYEDFVRMGEDPDADLPDEFLDVIEICN